MLLTARKIHDGRKWLPEGTVIETDDNGTITAVYANPPDGKTMYFDGVLAPGFVNVHCHLELSHMKGAIPERTGLIPFLQQVMQHRQRFSDAQRTQPRLEAFKEMLDNGIVAVGDIANTSDTADLRAAGKIHFHTFVESIGFTKNPDKLFEQAVALHRSFTSQERSSKRLSQSIVPHAPYSVSHVLFDLIDKYDERSLITIHNQETRAEDEYFLIKKGGIQTLLHSLNIDDDFFTPSGKSSLQTYLEWLSPSHPFIFVHNTYTHSHDIEVAQTLLPQVYWCLCPNANLYIENELPDIGLFIQEKSNICIGTDSLASNHQLCILSELYTIKQRYSHLEWEKLLSWGIYNGACALQMQDIIGTIEVGKQPGIIQITHLDEDTKPVATRII